MKFVLRLFKTSIFYLFFVITFIVFSIPLLFVSYIYRPSVFFNYWLLAKACLFALGIRTKIFGRIPGNGRPYIVISNHCSFVDIFLLIVYFRGKCGNIFAHTKLRYLIPLNFWLFLMKIIFINPKTLEGVQKGVEKAEKFLNERRGSMFIFPEGTRTQDGKIKSFKSRFAKLARSTDSEVLPVGLYGAYEFKPKNRWWIKPGKVVIYMGNPIRLNGSTVRELVDLAEKEVGLCVEEAKKKYK